MSALTTVSYNPQSSTRVTSDLGFAGLMSRPMLTAAGTSSCNSSRGIGTRTAYRQDRGWTFAFGGNPGLKAHVWGVSFTSLEQRGIPLYRSACARKPRPPFRADKFQSLDARRLVQHLPMRRPRGNVARGLAAPFLPGKIEATARMGSKYQTRFHA